MNGLTRRLDRLTRSFWRISGRPADLTGAEAWLSAPMHSGRTVGDGWLAASAEAFGGQVCERVEGAGLLSDMAQLDGPDFTASDLRPEIRHFYEHTSDWRMEVWTQWNPFFQPGGDLALLRPSGAAARAAYAASRRRLRDGQQSCDHRRPRW